MFSFSYSKLRQQSRQLKMKCQILSVSSVLLTKTAGALPWELMEIKTAALLWQCDRVTLTRPWPPRSSSSSARSARGSPCRRVLMRSLRAWSAHWNTQNDIQYMMSSSMCVHLHEAISVCFSECYVTSSIEAPTASESHRWDPEL